ncbi:MAG: N-6 DNA methylase, partial [candidate division KSB1 bacterium]|nr:N-6 DNA methylase [candidate division KSB1 bacterium]
MLKKTKLHEKSARIPEVREWKWEKTIASYLESITTLTSESARSQRFLLLLNDLFGLQPGFIEEYVSGIEKYVKVKQKDRLLKGRVDELFGSLIMEFERNLAQKQTEAEEQLKKYLACLWSQETPGQRMPYLCLATDGVSFAVYSPILQEAKKEAIQPEEIQLKLIDQIDWSGLEPQEVYFWLDRYFLRQESFSPKTENITKDFGIKSHAFQVASQSLLSLWRSLGSKPEFVIMYESWSKYLLLVYGSSVADAELFIRHTYLATLAKLMAWSRLSQIGDSAFSRTSTRLNDHQLISILEGQFFKDQGIENFLEEDLFCWITRQQAQEVGVEIARKLLSLLQNYNLRELSEDVLKSLYQELVDPATRHDLGEYYTPDWLAHRMIKKLIQNNSRASVLDPSCGSGTFLYLTVREKRERLPESSETLHHILSAVAGVDIHPLAVIVAKTNYLLALGDLLKKRKGRMTIPIYLADTLRLPEHEVQRNLEAPLPSYMVEIDGRTVYLPEKLLEKPALYDEGIEAAKEFALQNLGKSVTEEQFANYVQAQHAALVEDEGFVHALFLISETLKEFIESRRDTIWAFILKNIYKPLFLKGKYDLVVGNPPWLSFRYAEPEYQKFLKEQITRSYRLLSGKGELITHIELATLFLVRAADLYLKKGGNIAFVLPRSLFSADQHDALRQGKFKGVALQIQEIWDLEKVTPLFHVPACVLFCQKESSGKVTYPIAGQMLKGELTRHNAALEEAEKRLVSQNIQISLSRVGKRSFWTPAEGITGERESYYRGYFRQGASIVPRPFWFVE